jgi:hypothetical protein
VEELSFSIAVGGHTKAKSPEALQALEEDIAAQVGALVAEVKGCTTASVTFQATERVYTQDLLVDSKPQQARVSAVRRQRAKARADAVRRSGRRT